MEADRIIDTGVEALLNSELQRPAPYYAKVLESQPTKPGCWEYLRVGIFERYVDGNDVQIGEYQRNYSSMYRTFHPFQLRCNWYALYSKDYTSTRIMKLPSCEDIGGEERETNGFCPTDYWVPPLCYIESVHPAPCPRATTPEPCTCRPVHGPTCPYTTRPVNENASGPCDCGGFDEYYKWHHIWHFPDRVHGFIAGCVWGDDSSWKIQYLDLSRADEGIIKREERFGYIQLPNHLTLDKAVELEAGSEDYYVLQISTMDYYSLKDGKKHAD
jgi:hypothetical protein